jgi:replicative superfamily II helicase
LADEKFEDWLDESHTFFKYKIEILTGDFILSEEKRQKLNEADIIVLTPEMFNSKCRSFNNHIWLKNSVIIGDEIHLIGLEGRGDSLEVSIVQYYENNPDARCLFLSATLPNVNDFGRWLEIITGRPSKVIVSNYRPCKININWQSFISNGSYADAEDKRRKTVIELIEKFKEEPTIVFVGSKKFGNELCSQLKLKEIPHYFHNADLDREKRRKIEKEFKTGQIKVLISTSTLAWGVNTTARYGIICHTTIGINPMHPANILQEIGRVGRTGWSEKGDVYIVCENKKIKSERSRIFDEYIVSSTLHDINTLMFHILSYIVDKLIANEQELYDWYKKTLSSVQENHISLESAKRVLDNLKTRMMIKKNETGDYEATKIGEITAKMYMSPLDVSDWFKNFSKLKKLNPQINMNSREQDLINMKVANALAEAYNFGKTWRINREGKPEQYVPPKAFISEQERNCPDVVVIGEKYNIVNTQTHPYLKYTSVFYNLLNGEEVHPILNSYKSTIVKDIDRFIQTMNMLDVQVGSKLKKAGKVDGFDWNKEWFVLGERLRYGCKLEALELVRIPGIGKKRSDELLAKGITTKEDLKNPKNRDKCERALGKKTYEKILKEI